MLHDWCNKGCGVWYPVCGLVHIKEPLLLIGNSIPSNGGSGFLLIVWMVHENVLNVSLNKTFPFFLCYVHVAALFRYLGIFTVHTLSYFSFQLLRHDWYNKGCGMCYPVWDGAYKRKERNVWFNDALNTFYLQLYGVRHMVKDHSDSWRGNLLPPHRLFFLISSKGSLYAPSHRHDCTYHSLCYTSRGALAGTRNSSMGPPWGIELMTHHTMSYIWLRTGWNKK